MSNRNAACRLPLADRFAASFIGEPNSGCWLWEGAGTKRYGKIRLAGKLLAAHRVSWELSRGPIPDGSVVCHRCDNTFCVNPDHLFVGTQRDNVIDMVTKGRRADTNGHNNPNANSRKALMAYDNSGSVSKNKRKEQPNHPDIKGKATIAGVEYWVDGWQKDGENGKWYSLSFKPKDAERPNAKPAAKADDDSDLPF